MGLSHAISRVWGFVKGTHKRGGGDIQRSAISKETNHSLFYDQDPLSERIMDKLCIQQAQDNQRTLLGNQMQCVRCPVDNHNNVYFVWKTRGNPEDDLIKLKKNKKTLVFQFKAVTHMKLTIVIWPSRNI